MPSSNPLRVRPVRAGSCRPSAPARRSRDSRMPTGPGCAEQAAAGFAARRTRALPRQPVSHPCSAPPAQDRDAWPAQVRTPATWGPWCASVATNHGRWYEGGLTAERWSGHLSQPQHGRARSRSPEPRQAGKRRERTGATRGCVDSAYTGRAESRCAARTRARRASSASTHPNHSAGDDSPNRPRAVQKSPAQPQRRWTA